MKYRDGRGQNKIEEANANKERVRDWFDANPKSTISECCKALSLTYKTVRRCLNELDAERWVK